jgi:hypothetical protein
LIANAAENNLRDSLTPKPAYYITAKKMSIAAAGWLWRTADSLKWSKKRNDETE